VVGEGQRHQAGAAERAHAEAEFGDRQPAAAEYVAFGRVFAPQRLHEPRRTQDQVADAEDRRHQKRCVEDHLHKWTR